MQYKQGIFYSIVYLLFSLAFETSLIVLGGLRVPDDNAILGPLVITIPPIFAALLFSRKSIKRFFYLFILTAILTFVVTLIFVRITGVQTGFVEPIINRSIAGFLAFILAEKFARK